MDQVKIGKFIAEMRKSVGLTQDELGERLFIKGQSVSKWERGLNLPDTSILLELSEILNVSVTEILKGERIDNKNKDNNKPKTLSPELVKYVKKKQDKRLFRRVIILGVALTFIIIILFLYSVNNYNKFNIYSLECSHDDLTVKGMIIFNPTDKFIRISGIEYNDIYVNTNSELKAKNIMIKIGTSDRTFLEYGNIDENIENLDIKSINELLDTIFVNNSEPIKKNEYSILKSDVKKLIISLIYIDENDEKQTLQYKLDTVEEFSNNKLFYK